MITYYLIQLVKRKLFLGRILQKGSVQFLRISKIIRLMGSILLVLVLGVIVCIYELNGSYHHTKEALENQSELKQLGHDLGNASDTLTDEARMYAIYGAKANYDNYWKEVNETKTRDRVVARLQELGVPQEELALIELAKKNSDALVKIEEQAMQAVSQQDLDKARQLMFSPAYEQAKEQILQPIHEFQNKMSDRVQQETSSQEHKTDTLLTLINLMIGAFAVLLIGTFVALMSKSRKLLRVANTIAANQSDLTLRITNTGRDEVGQIAGAFNRMMHNFQNLIHQIQQASHQTAASAEQLQASAEQTTQATEQIVASVQEIAAGTEHQVQTVREGRQVLLDINNTLQEVTSSASTVSEKVNQASVTARDGNTAIHSAVEQMNSIHVTIRQLSDVIRELGERSQNIDQIVGVITSIAQQTNLLSLNAAIEAARAGEHGRGFAVVADEVRALAEQSNSSAQRIAEYIAVIQSEIEQAVRTMEVGNQEVLLGLDVVSQAGHSFAAIQHSVEDIDLHMSAVFHAARELTESSVLSAAIDGISDIAESNANQTQFVSSTTEEQLATMEEIGASSASLSEMSEHLQQLVRQFQVEK